MSDVYDDVFFENIAAGSLESARIVVPLLLGMIPAQSVVDFGCGLGAWLRAFLDHGVARVLGLDGAYVDRSKMLIDPRDFREVDLARGVELGETFDLGVCLEVGEHLPAGASKKLVQALTGSARIVLFSAAVPGQGGTNHLNEQWPSYWERLFHGHGFVKVDLIRPLIWQDRRIKWYYRQNLLLYCQRGALSSCESLSRAHAETAASDMELISKNCLSRYQYPWPLFVQALKSAIRSVKTKSMFSRDDRAV
jgi:SAM-dependent methyltransferase